jgi:outer membrane protein assembly factor BamA
VGSFSPKECTSPQTDQCPEFDRLLGSRVAVASAELRLPLIGTSEFGLLDIPFLPTEVAPFVDAGVAWNAHDRPTFRFVENTTERVPVVSAGVTARMNLLGYVILEVYAAHPFQRPTKNWSVGVQLVPGW